MDTAAFEWFILVLIFASSVTLCFEDIHLDENPRLKKLLYWTNLAFSVIFIIEMFFKWVALGFNKYFSSFWTLLDFLIVFVRILFKLLVFLLLKVMFVGFFIQSSYRRKRKSTGAKVLADPKGATPTQSNKPLAGNADSG